MSDFHRLDVRIPGVTGNKGEVLIDGKPVMGVRRIEFSTGVNEITVVKIELLTADLLLTVDDDRLTAMNDVARVFSGESRDA